MQHERYHYLMMDLSQTAFINVISIAIIVMINIVIIFNVKIVVIITTSRLDLRQTGYGRAAAAAADESCSCSACLSSSSSSSTTSSSSLSSTLSKQSSAYSQQLKIPATAHQDKSSAVAMWWLTDRQTRAIISKNFLHRLFAALTITTIYGEHQSPYQSSSYRRSSLRLCLYGREVHNVIFDGHLVS